MAEVDADVWVLTETHVEHAPSDEHTFAAFSPPHPERRPVHERWAAIRSRWPLAPVADPPAHRRGTVAAVVEAPTGPLLVYGTVIAWANEPTFDDGRPARMWEVHLAEIGRQSDEWRRLRSALPDLPMVVAGDFNQDRDGSGWYGTARTRRRLGEALDLAGLTCVTDMDAEVEGLLPSGHLVDHVCLSPDLVRRSSIRCWPQFDESGQRLSDHPTVVVDLAM
jgi:endonuclease/exonuclease/phosphatase family metal-dependent hydrolase